MKRRNKNKFLSSGTEKTNLSKAESAKLRNTLAMSMAANIGIKYLEHVRASVDEEKTPEEKKEILQKGKELL